MKLNPNCSEAIFRLRTGKLKANEKVELDRVIEKLKADEEIWGDTYTSEKKIFGIEHIEINGQAPYHHGDELKEELSKLPFWKKLECEKDEA